VASSAAHHQLLSGGAKNGSSTRLSSESRRSCPVVVPFGKTYKGKGCTTTTQAIASAISKSPSAYYVNVHNAKYPGGALRGQLKNDG